LLIFLCFVVNPDFNKKSQMSDMADGAPPVWSPQDLSTVKQQGVAPSSGARDILFASKCSIRERSALQLSTCVWC